MAWKSHWHTPSPKSDWVEDIRNDIAKLYHNPGALASLSRLTKKDAMILAEVLTDAVKNDPNRKH